MGKDLRKPGLKSGRGERSRTVGNIAPGVSDG